MRFVIRNLVDVEEASPATAPEILLDGTVKAPRNHARVDGSSKRRG
jgi:hypothetical protein